MNRIELSTLSAKQASIDKLYEELERRIASGPVNTCPVDMALGCLKLCTAQSCGKCVPCRVGLLQLGHLLEDVIENRGTEETFRKIEDLAASIVSSADCAIGTRAAELVLKSTKNYAADYMEHIMHHECLFSTDASVPCMALCPARVDIPGYIALAGEGRFDDAVRLIRKDNPFPSACAYICEHPCESHCRRNLLDDAVNIRGIKRAAVDRAKGQELPPIAEATGKKVAILGGGPAGLTAAYYLRLMGHSVTIFEMRSKLGGMLRYGIPEYRLPKAKLDEDIDYIISTGVEVKYGVKVGTDLGFDELKREYDSIFVAIGAHNDKKLGIEGENSNNVISAVKFLADIGEGKKYDFSGKNVVVVGGGNVAMDATRTSVRLGAKNVTCVYRRRIVDMTALPEEVSGAQAEGALINELQAPVRLNADAGGNVISLTVQPQVIGKQDASGRPVPYSANKPEVDIPADVVIVAIGQAIDSAPFKDSLPINRERFVAGADCKVSGLEDIFAGGDAVTGPATVIKAIAAGKTAAANIDCSLGFDHKISVDIDIPAPKVADKPLCGRIEISELSAAERKGCFDCIECGMTDEETDQESSRCLRCDCYGFGIFKGGRQEEW